MTETYETYGYVQEEKFQNIFLMMLAQMSHTLQNLNSINSLLPEYQLILVDEFVSYVSSQMIDLKIHQRLSNLKKGIT